VAARQSAVALAMCQSARRKSWPGYSESSRTVQFAFREVTGGRDWVQTLLLATPGPQSAECEPPTPKRDSVVEALRGVWTSGILKVIVGARRGTPTPRTQSVVESLRKAWTSGPLEIIVGANCGTPTPKPKNVVEATRGAWTPAP
jgi:hypothetical protein